MAIKRRQKAPKREPKPKLKTMNDISAAEAVKLFHAAMALDDEPTSLYAPIPKGFPKDIAAKDFIEQLLIYRDMWSEGEKSAAGALYAAFSPYEMSADEIVAMARAPIARKDSRVEKALKKVTPKERELLELIHRKPWLLVKQLGGELKTWKGTVKRDGAIKAQLSSLFKQFKVHKRAELIAKTRPFFPQPKPALSQP